MKTYEKLMLGDLKDSVGKTLFIAHREKLVLSKLVTITSLGNFIFEDSLEIMRADISNNYIKIYRLTPKAAEKKA